MALPAAHLRTTPSTESGATWMPDSVLNHPAVMDLLRPLDPDEFFAHWWERAPVHAPLSESRRGALLTPDDFDGLLRVAVPGATAFEVRCATAGRDGLTVIEDAPTLATGRYDVEAIYRRFSQGRSIVGRRLDARWRPVTRLCRGLEAALRCPVDAELRWVPRGGAGLGPRCEELDLFVLQLDGRRTWRLHEPDRGPTAGLALGDTMRDASTGGSVVGGAWGEATLSGGDLLYVPRGWTHRPSPPAGTSSLHLAVAVRPLRWSDLLARVVALAAERDPELDRGIPLGDPDRPDVRNALLGRLPELLKGLTDPSLHHLAAGALAPEFLTQMTPPPEGRADTSLDLDAIDADTPVLRRMGLPCAVRDEGMVATIHFPGGHAAFPRRLRPALEFIARSGRFTARQMPPAIAPDAALFLVRRLCREGLLTLTG